MAAPARAEKFEQALDDFRAVTGALLAVICRDAGILEAAGAVEVQRTRGSRPYWGTIGFHMRPTTRPRRVPSTDAAGEPVITPIRRHPEMISARPPG